MGEDQFMITPDALEAGIKIQGEGSLFEDQISLIQSKVLNCANAWKGDEYDSFQNQTNAAAAELTELRDFFEKYGANIVKFAEDSEETQKAIKTYIDSNR